MGSYNPALRAERLPALHALCMAVLKVCSHAAGTQPRQTHCWTVRSGNLVCWACNLSLAVLLEISGTGSSL